MPHPHAFFEPARTIKSFLHSGKSVLLSAPSGARIALLLNDIAADLKTIPATQVIRINISSAYEADGRFMVSTVWQQMSLALHYEVDARAESATDVGILLAAYFHDNSHIDRLAFIFTGVRNASAQAVYTFLGELHSRQLELGALGKILQFVASDAFSLKFHIKRNLSLGESELISLEHVETPVLDEKEIADGLALLTRSIDSSVEVGDIAKKLFELTGGHYSLLMIAIEYLQSFGFKVSDAFWCSDLLRHFENSDVVRRLRQALSEDREGIVDTALKYRSGLLHEDTRNHRTIKLRKLGVLYLTLDNRLKLCGGFIGRLIEAINDEAPSEEESLGTFHTPSGLAAYEGGVLNVGEGDIVMLHLSDLHTGSEHAFRVPKTGRAVVGDRTFLAEYIQNDLERLGVAGRVDGLLLSGDITCTADGGEFARAAEIIVDIATRAGIPKDAIALVPGNHDIQWQPGEFSQRHSANGNVSRENFDRFYKEVVGHSPEFPEITRLKSRNGSEVIDVVCLDSNHVEGPEAAGIGMIDPAKLDAVAHKLAKTTLEQPQQQRRVWLMSHHHYVPVCDVDTKDALSRKVSVMANASRVLNLARSIEAEVIVHGHQHQPFLSQLSRWTGGTDDGALRPMLLIGAGSVGAKREDLGPIAQNQYFLLILQQHRLIVRSRKFGEEGLGFTLHQDFVFPRPIHPR